MKIKYQLKFNEKSADIKKAEIAKEPQEKFNKEPETKEQHSSDDIININAAIGIFLIFIFLFYCFTYITEENLIVTCIVIASLSILVLAMFCYIQKLLDIKSHLEEQKKRMSENIIVLNDQLKQLMLKLSNAEKKNLDLISTNTKLKTELQFQELSYENVLKEKKALKNDISILNTSIQNPDVFLCKQKELRDAIEKAETAHNQLLKKNEILTDSIERLKKQLNYKQDMLKDVCVPDQIFFDNKNLPHYLKQDGTDLFTVYITEQGTKYHENRFCPGYANRGVNVFEVCRKYTPCSKCVKNHVLKGAIPDWYKSYLALLK